MDHEGVKTTIQAETSKINERIASLTTMVESMNNKLNEIHDDMYKGNGSKSIRSRLDLLEHNIESQEHLIETSIKNQENTTRGYWDFKKSVIVAIIGFAGTILSGSIGAAAVVLVKSS